MEIELESKLRSNLKEALGWFDFSKVYRYYNKNGKRIRIAGFGRTKLEALKNLDFEIWQESQYI